MACKYLDARQTLHGKLLKRPLISKNRFFVNLAYKTYSNWNFDTTFNWNDGKRIPNTSSNPTEFQFMSRSPDFWICNAQIGKQIGKKLELYLGGENLFDFRQNRLISNPQNPFGSYFDASLVWGPVIGRMIYGGLRFTIR